MSHHDRPLGATRNGQALLRDASGPRESSLVKTVDSTIVDQDALDKLARRINSLYREATLDVTCAIGKLVISELYEGNVTLWGEQGTHRPSYRKLAARGDLLLSPSALCRAVAIYALCERLGDRGRWRHLTASHLQEVLGLDRSHQERLLRVADAEQWSVSRLRTEVTKQRPKSSRSRHPGLLPIARRLKAFMVKYQTTLEDAKAVLEADADVALELATILVELKARLKTLELLLIARTKGS